MKSSRFNLTTSIIILNVFFTFLLMALVGFMLPQVFNQRQEIKKLQDMLQDDDGKYSFKNKESAHIVGGVNKLLISPPPFGDVYRVKSWKQQHISGKLNYDNNGHLTVNADGTYYVYCQMFYYDGNCSFTGFNVYIDNKIILKAIASVIDIYKPYYTQYTGGVFKITKGQRIWVGTNISRKYFINEISSFFGAYILHS
ncbi:uncharacterized protein LOC114535707 [Dendronephthya gigantea]|uniref:uncharacterized protein LOC114535707 n=1 Tax=Dendronephthya gigantea TaxID=151771 RepID=UPI00106D099E|nr:uncharacterized protein LOC114535707 [Dendronephthya gigantea]